MKQRPADGWFVYILRCGDGTFYTGITKDVGRRCRQHNEGTASRYTRSRCPVRVVYHEVQPDQSSALRREAAIKAMSHREKEAIIHGTSTWDDVLSVLLETTSSIIPWHTDKTKYFFTTSKIFGTGARSSLRLFMAQEKRAFRRGEVVAANARVCMGDAPSMFGSLACQEPQRFGYIRASAGAAGCFRRSATSS